MRQDIDYELDI